MSSKLIKEGGSVMIEVITILFNMSIAQGKFPDALKNAKIIPIHKGDSRLEMSNYRPISLLPTLSKIFEKLMYSRLICFSKNTIYSMKTNMDFKVTCLLNML
jgi:TPP-dependent 2-oxoacid decarboxylase